MIEYKLASKLDIDGILDLQAKNLVTNLKDDEKDDGFVTTPFVLEQINSLIEQKGFFIAKEEGKVISSFMNYVMILQRNWR